MAITTMDGLVAGVAASQRLDFFKATATAEGAATWHSLWAIASVPPAGAAAGSENGAVPTDATTGAFSFTNPGSGSSYLGRLQATGTTLGTLTIYDRIWHNSALEGNVATSQAITFPGLTRYTTGAGVQLWGEIYSAIGATAATLTVTYTDQDGNTGQSATYAHPANAEAVGQMFRLTLAAGDTGVRAVSAAQWSISTGTAGNFGLTMLVPLAQVSLGPVANVGNVLDAFGTGMPIIVDDACLAMMVQCTATNTGVISGSLDIVQG